MSRQKGRQTGQRFVRSDFVTRNAQHHKPAESTRCPRCGATVHKGRWTWQSQTDDGAESLCPACERIVNNDPGGQVALMGPFIVKHHDELVHLIHNIEEREKAEHPLKRLISIEREADTVLVRTTDDHLARTIGEALKSAYEGELDYDFVESGNLFRVAWKR